MRVQVETEFRSASVAVSSSFMRLKLADMHVARVCNVYFAISCMCVYVCVCVCVCGWLGEEEGEDMDGYSRFESEIAVEWRGTNG